MGRTNLEGFLIHLGLEAQKSSQLIQMNKYIEDTASVVLIVEPATPAVRFNKIFI